MLEAEKKLFYRMLGERIRDARIAAGLKQDALAGQLGKSRVSIVNIEKGRQHPPLDLIWDIASLLKVEIVAILPDLEPQSDMPEKWKRLIEKQTINDEKSQEKLLGFIEKMKSPSS